MFVKCSLKLFNNSLLALGKCTFNAKPY